MNKLLLRLMTVALAAGWLAASAMAQGAPPPQGAEKSLAEQAAEALKNKPPASPTTVVWTNDNVPSSGRTDSGASAAPSSSTAPAEAASGVPETKPRSDEEMKKLEDQWRKKFKDQKDKIELLQRELTVSQRENQIRATTFYADAGNRLRDPGKYAEDDRKYQAETAAKQQQLADAKQKLEDMKEELRKAGLPSSWAE